MGDYTHLSMSDRRRFHIFLEMGLSMAEIAKRLSKHRSTLYRERNRNQEEGAYLPGVAQEKAKEPAGPGRAESGRAEVKGPDLSQVTARKNLNETAFFFPQLLSDGDGVVKLQFTMPEALTQWRFLGFAHDQQVRSGFLEGHAITAKDLMVQPNPPRFLREGDALEFTVKVSNQTAARQQGKVRLAFSDAQSQQSADGLLGNGRPEIPFDVPARQSRSYSWSIKVPDGVPFLTYKAVGSTGTVSDGEEGYLPVLSRRIFVTE